MDNVPDWVDSVSTEEITVNCLFAPQKDLEAISY